MNHNPCTGAPRRAPTPPERREAPVASERPHPGNVGIVAALREITAAAAARIEHEHGDDMLIDLYGRLVKNEIEHGRAGPEVDRELRALNGDQFARLIEIMRAHT